MQRRVEILKTKPDALFKKPVKKVKIESETGNEEVIVVKINGKKTRLKLDEQHE